ncbi:MAG: OsmC family protein [Acidobacteriota bacterium]
MPHVSLSIDWLDELSFRNSEGSPQIEMASSVPGITSPPQALAYAVMACTAMDVVHILKKGRQDLRALTVRFEGERAETHPRRFISMHLHFDVTGNVEEHAVERAIELSKTTYCSVWNSLRTDIALTTTFKVGA